MQDPVHNSGWADRVTVFSERGDIGFVTADDHRRVLLLEDLLQPGSAAAGGIRKVLGGLLRDPLALRWAVAAVVVFCRMKFAIKPGDRRMV